MFFKALVSCILIKSHCLQGTLQKNVKPWWTREKYPIHAFIYSISNRFICKLFNFSDIVCLKVMAWHLSERTEENHRTEYSVLQMEILAR